MDTKAERIGDIIEKLFRSRRISREPGALTELRKVWDKALGPDLAPRLAPAMLKSGVLWIKVDSSALFFEMKNFAAGRLLGEIQALVPGCFRELRFFQ